MPTTQRAQAQSRVRWELLEGIVRKDMKVKYQGSVLGFLWSLANPLLLLAVYTFVFGVVFKTGIPNFGFYMLCGLLLWNFFAGAVSNSVGCVVGNAGLVQKVPFPLAVLPLSQVGFALIHLILQLATMLVVMAISGYTVMLGPALLLMFPAIAVAVILATGVSFLVAALNVKYRDTAHIVEILLMAGIWLNPVVYAVVQIYHEMGRWVWLYWLNPMADVIVCMQRAVYAADVPIKGSQDLVLAGHTWLFYIERLGLGGAISLLILFLGYRVYSRNSADFAEAI